MTDRWLEVLTSVIVFVAVLAIGAAFGAQLRQSQICDGLKKAKTELTLAACREDFGVVPVEWSEPQ